MDSDVWLEFENEINDTMKMESFDKRFESHFGMENCLVSAKDVTEFVYHTKDESATGLIFYISYILNCYLENDYLRYLRVKGSRSIFTGIPRLGYDFCDKFGIDQGHD